MLGAPPSTRARLDCEGLSRAIGSGRATIETMNQRTCLLIVMSACFACVALDNTKLVAALPTLARQSDATPDVLRWLVEVNLLVYASLLLLGGSLSERFGPRRMLLVGLGLFGTASVLGALSTSLSELLLSRALLGVGAACMTPASLATLKHTFSPEQRPRALGIWTASFGIGAAAGPVLAGSLLARGGIELVLLANLPLALLCAAGTARWVPADLPKRNLPLDFFGALLCLLTAACLLFAVLSGPVHGWLTPQVTGAALLALASGLVALKWLRRADHPLIDPSLFGEPGLGRTLLVIVLGYFAFSGVSFVVAQYLQLARERSAFSAGLINLPLPLSLMCGTLFAPRLILQFDGNRALGWSVGTAAIGALLLAQASVHTSDLWFSLVLVPFGAGCGAAFVTATELTVGAVSAERAAIVAGLSEAAFEFGGVLGVATLSSLVATDALSRANVVAFAPRALGAGALALLLALPLTRQVNKPSPQPDV